MPYIPLSCTSSPCNLLFLNLCVYALVQATVGVGTVLIYISLGLLRSLYKGGGVTAVVLCGIDPICCSAGAFGSHAPAALRRHALQIRQRFLSPPSVTHMPPAPDPTVDVADPEPDPGPVPLDLGEGGAAHGGLAAVLRRLAAIEVSQQAILHKLHEVHRGPEAPPRRRSSCSADLGKGPMAPISLADLPDLTHAADPGRAARERPVAYFDHATPRSPIHKPRDRPEFPIHKPRDRPECPRDPPPPDAAPADPPAPLRVLSLESNLNHEQKRRPSQIELHDKNSLSFEEDALAKQASNAADLVRLARTAHRQNGTLLKPDALWRQFWNLLWLLLCLAEGGLLLVCLVWVDLARWDQPLVHVLAGLYGASTVFFAADMALQFRTISRAMIESGSGTVSEARAHYLASLFAPDLLCTLPVAALLVPLGPQGFLAGAVLRLLRVERARHLLMWSDPLKQMPRHMYLQRFSPPPPQSAAGFGRLHRFVLPIRCVSGILPIGSADSLGFWDSGRLDERGGFLWRGLVVHEKGNFSIRLTTARRAAAPERAHQRRPGTPRTRDAHELPALQHLPGSGVSQKYPLLGAE